MTRFALNGSTISLHNMTEIHVDIENRNRRDDTFFYVTSPTAHLQVHPLYSLPSCVHADLFILLTLSHEFTSKCLASLVCLKGETSLNSRK